MTIENEIELLKGFSKPIRNAGYDKIAKKFNKEIVALGDARRFADVKLIDKKLGLPDETILRWEDILITLHFRKPVRTE